MNTAILMEGAVSFAFQWVAQMLGFFMQPPLVYFTAVTLVGSIVGVARKYVPMRRR